MLARRTRTPLLISRRAQVCRVCAPFDTQFPFEALIARTVEETRSPRCLCSSRFSNFTSPPVRWIVCRLKFHLQYAWLHCGDLRLTVRVWHTGNRCHEPSCQLACKDIAEVLLCLSHLISALNIELFESRSRASRHCSRRAILQVCRLSDPYLQTAGVAVNLESAVAKYVLGQQHIADLN